MTAPTVRVRFAPSPTGLLHIGGLRTALYNYLVARKERGQFVLRIEDTDRTRFVVDAEQYIYDSLRWAGIEPDEGPKEPGSYGPYRQSERLDLYRKYADLLVEAGKAYLAFDTEGDIETLRNRPDTGTGTARYDASTRMSMRNSLTLPPDEVERLKSAESYVIRLLVPDNTTIVFTDTVRGEVAFDSAEVDDQILVKSDGFPTYHLANVVDDHEMAITHVIRGEEWLPSTPKHILLYRAFAWEPPAMAHLPLIMSPSGGKLSKRSGDRHGIPVFVLEYAEAGFEPEAVINYIALLGWHPGSDQERFELSELIASFSLDRVGSAGVQFDMDKLRWFNQQYLRELPTTQLAMRMRTHVEASGYSATDEQLEAIAELLRDRLTMSRDVLDFAEFFRDPAEYDAVSVQKRWKASTSGLVSGFADRLEALDDWRAPALEEALEAFIADSGVGKGQFMPALRLALSGRPNGPDLFKSMELVAQDNTLRRMRAAAAQLSTEAASS
jgi:glutamyl-tRNA synthetase